MYKMLHKSLQLSLSLTLTVTDCDTILSVLWLLWHHVFRVLLHECSRVCMIKCWCY